MSKSVLHVVPHDQAWAVKREGNERASSTHPTQKEAIDSARELAKELDDIVIHRPDGTIRERVTYFGATGQPHAAANGEAKANGNAAPAAASETTQTRTARPRLQDVLSVGSRVSWGAIVAGAAMAVAAYVTLTLLALAVGLSVAERQWGHGFTVAAAAISGLILMVSLFLGGFVASRATARERQLEAAIYGVLVWATVFSAFLAGGLSLGFGYLGGVGQVARQAEVPLAADRVKAELGLTDQQAQQYEAMTRNPEQAVAAKDATSAAWWAFTGVLVSLIAAVAGGLVGAGPELMLRRADDRPAVVVPQPA
jgi:hypothetical protein